MPKTIDVEGVGPVEFPEDASQEEISEALNRQYPPPKVSGLKAFGQHAAMGIAPGAAFVGAFGEVAPVATGLAIETGPWAPVIGGGAGLVAGLGASALTQFGQGKLLQAIAPQFAKKLQAELVAGQQQHPVLAGAGEVASLAPSAKLAPLALRTLPFRAALGAGVGAALPVVTEQRPPTAQDIAVTAAMGTIYGEPRINLGGRLAAIARAKTMLPRAAAQAEREVADAISQRTITESDLRKYKETGEGGLPERARAGRGDSLQQGGPEPQVQAGVQPAEVSEAGRQRVLVENRPAIKTMPDEAGKFTYVEAERLPTGEWETHDQIIERAGLKTDQIDRRVFLDEQGREKPREQTAQELAVVGEPTKVPGEAHSTDVNRLAQAPSVVAAPTVPPVEKPAAVTEAAAKEPWQMTRSEWEDATRKASAAELKALKALSGSPLQKSLAWATPERIRLQYGAEAKPIRKRGVPVVTHRNVIEKALAEGKPVPPEVLADYPELKPSLAPAPKPAAPKADVVRLVQQDASKKVPEARDTLDAHETVPTDLAGKPASLGKWLTRTARPSEKAPETQTSRLTTLQSPDNQRVAVVSTYDHPRYGAMLFDPTGGTKHVALTTLLKQGWKPIASTLTKDPHSRFRKVFGSMEAYQSEVAQPLAEARAALKTYPAPTQVTEPVVPTAAETVTDPIVAHLAQHPTLNAAIAAIQTAPNRRQIQAAIRSAMDDLQQKNPKLTDEQAAEQVLNTFYEQSRRPRPAVEPGTAPEVAPTAPAEPTPTTREAEIAERWIVDQQKRAAKTGLGKASPDAALKVVSEWIRKGETPEGKIPKNIQDAIYRSLPFKTFDMETGEVIDASHPDWPRTGTLLDFLDSQYRKRIPTEAPKAAIAEPDPESPHGVRLDVTTPAEHPLGPIDTGTTPTLSLWQNLSGELKEAAAGLRAFWRAFAMQALPKISAENRVAGEAGVRYDASRRVARAKGIEFAGKVTEGIRDRTFDKKLGTAIVEDNFRDVKRAFNDAGDTEAANRVPTLIGARNSPFPTEAQYQRFLNDPQNVRVIQKHKQLWKEQKDPIYRKANDLDPDLELKSRGLQTGARINLKAVLPGDMTRTAVGGTGRASLIRQAATRLRRDPFARQAKGTGQAYEVSYQELMASGFEREYPIAAQHEFIKELVDSGLANVTPQEFPKELTVRGERPKAYELKIRPWRNYWIQVPRSLAPEFENVMGLTPSWQVPGVRHMSDFLTSASVQGFAEGSTHVANLSTGILTGLGPTANPMLNALIKSAGRADVLYQLPRILIRGFAKNQSEMLRLAEIGAAKEPYTGLLGWFINRIDRGVRLVSADTYREMAAKGWVVDTETGLREYVNQVGQYSKRLQPAVIARLRETGIQPFATAAHTFNVMGLRTLGFGPAAKSPTWYGALALRADKAGGLMGFIVLTAALNKLLSGNASGPPGTQLGNVGWRDDQGKVKQFPLARLFGYERGPRITGLQAYAEARRLGLPKATALTSGLSTIGGSGLSYVSGPMVQFATKAITGKRPGVPMVREAKPVLPQEEDEFDLLKTQAAANIAAALQQANPAIDASLMVLQGKELPEILRRQFSRYTPRPGMSEATIEAMPKIVHSKQMFDYASALAKEARKQPRSERNDFINKRLEEDDVTGKDRAEAMRLLKLKGVFRYE